MAIDVGDVAPDFSLPSKSGATISLSQFKGEKLVVVYFYPKDDTPGCTAESCAFRDSYEDFITLGAEVLGISSDSTESHQRFAQKYELPFHLLSDVGGATRKAYGVPATLGLLPGRVTYVIDREGIVRHRFNSQFNPKAHVTEALQIMRSL